MAYIHDGGSISDSLSRPEQASYASLEARHHANGCQPSADDQTLLNSSPWAAALRRGGPKNSRSSLKTSLKSVSDGSSLRTLLKKAAHSLAFFSANSGLSPLGIDDGNSVPRLSNVPAIACARMGPSNENVFDMNLKSK